MDVSKASLDAFSPADGAHRQFADDARGIALPVKWAGNTDDPSIVFEATGPHHRLPGTKLDARGMPLHKVNPRQARHFAQSTGRLVKTDRVDAEMSGRMGRVLNLPPRQPKPPHPREPQELVGARCAPVKEHIAARVRRRTATLKHTRDLVAKQVKLCEREIKKIEQLVLKIIGADAKMARRMELLQIMPGIGEVTAFPPLIEMSELGTLTGKRAAVLAGLAPVVRQSGQWRGKESISGGRHRLRCTLHMRAPGSMRCTDGFAAKAKDLRECVKAPKAVITAIMRNVPVSANAMPAKDGEWRPPRQS